MANEASYLYYGGQTVLPVKSFSIGQKLEENAKIGNATFLVTLSNVCLPG